MPRYLKEFANDKIREWKFMIDFDEACYESGREDLADPRFILAEMKNNIITTKEMIRRVEAGYCSVFEAMQVIANLKNY